MAKVSEDQAEKLWFAFEAASSKLRSGGGVRGQFASGAEAKYGAAYQALVAAGLAPQIRLKYR